MCFKKSKKAVSAAETSDRETQAKIAQQTAAIQAMFADPARQAQVADFLNGQRVLYRDQLDHAKQDTDRKLKFSLARDGMTGGSVDVDENSEQMRNYLAGILESDRRAQGDAAGLRAQDESMKQNLIQMANGGVDMTSAAQLAANGLRSSIANDQNTNTLDATNNFFSRSAALYQKSLEAKGVRDAQKGYGAGLYAPTPSYSGVTNTYGTASP